MKEQTYSVVEVGRLLNVHPMTVTAWIKAGKLKATLRLKPSKAYRISAAEVARMRSARINKLEKKLRALQREDGLL